MMLQCEAGRRRLAVTVRVAAHRLQLPLRVIWNVNLQLVYCFCGLWRGFRAEGKEGVRQTAAHAAREGSNQ